MLYNTPTSDTHNKIHKGTKTTSQSQRIKLSSLKARNTNCSIFTEQKSSNCNQIDNFMNFTTHSKKYICYSSLTSKDRSFLTAHIQIAIEMIDIKIRGTNTRIQKCLRDSKLSHTRSSKRRRSKCRARVMIIALYCT